LAVQWDGKKVVQLVGLKADRMVLTKVAQKAAPWVKMMVAG